MELPSTDTPPQPASRACVNCARAKAKCAGGRRDLDGKCQRCVRLKRECVFPQSARRTRKPGKRARVAEMEAKIDGLVALLQEKAGLNTDHLEPPLTPSPTDGGRPILLSMLLEGQEELVSSPHRSNGRACGARPGLCTNAHLRQATQSLVGIEPNTHEAGVSLGRLRQMLLYFPILYLPSTTTAKDLHRDRPFLYLCIMAVSCQSLPQQAAFGKEIMQYLGEHMLVRGEKSLDLLLGILTYAGWYTYNFRFTSTILQLAIALVFDLGLNRSRPNISKHELFEYAIRNSNDPMKNPCGDRSESRTRTLEEQRALVGCFFLTSVISTYFQTMEPLRLTSHIEDCVRNLAENPESPSDMVLVCLARSQMVVQRAGEIPVYETNGLGGSAPVGLYIGALQSQLQEVRKSFPQNLDQDLILLMHYHNVEMSICEAAFFRPRFPANGISFQRLEILHTCLKATQAFFETFLSVPVQLLRSISIFTYTQLAHALVTLHKLSTFESPDWNLDYVRGTVNLGSILDQLIRWFDDVKAHDGFETGDLEEHDVAWRTARKLQRIKQCHEHKVALNSIGIVPEASTPVLHAHIAIEDESLSFFNEDWLQEFLTPWDYPFDGGQPNSIT